VTLSVFILSGPQLKAKVSLEGPFANLDVSTGPELHAKVIEYTNSDKSQKDNTLFFTEDIDFEHLNDIIEEDGILESDDDDLLKQPILPDDPEADKKRLERRERQRKKFLDQKQRKEERRLGQLRRVREEGEPFIYTAKAPVSGWYRVCVHSNWNQASVVVGDGSGGHESAYRVLFGSVVRSETHNICC
jgi:hypothetical protein